jgi:hypothetical protein
LCHKRASAAATLHDTAILARLIELNRASDAEQIGKTQATCALG